MKSTTWPAAPHTVCAVARQCSRTGCSETSSVTLTYQYAHAQVWLDALSAERDPHSYDLCDRHADRLTAPQGWQVRDRRPEPVPVVPYGVREPAYIALAV